MTKGLEGRTGKKSNCKEGWEKRLNRRTGIVNEEKDRKRDWRDGREKLCERRKGIENGEKDWDRKEGRE